MTIPAAPDASVARAGLVYPHGAHVPADGGLLQVAEGVFWLRMPIPFSLDHINLWVLDAGDHWAIVDTGFPSSQAKAFWRQLFDGPLAGKPVGRVIVTHYHPDHIGLAGWLCARFQLPLEISRGEFLLARVVTLDTAPTPPADVVGFYTAQGWPDSAVEALKGSEWGRFARAVHRLPTGYRRLRAGDRLTIGGRHWDVVVGSGHSPEHVCLHAAAEGLLISGDQVLPRITSNVSVYPTEPEADPLGEWLDSIARLKTLPEETLVLPAHNEPFLGLHARLDQLAADHHRKLEALLEACAEPLSAFDSFATLFRRPIGAEELQMATGEALAHLRWLHRRGQVEAVTCDGVTRYRRLG
jgi:glyoxylase-like metal-dependent hydrolase (beta-lactamase superfamily II)